MKFKLVIKKYRSFTTILKNSRNYISENRVLENVFMLLWISEKLMNKYQS